MRLEEKVAKLFNEQNIASVLDLGVGMGKWSIFSASYGAKVIAIDNQSKALWQFPEYFKSHPSIIFFRGWYQEFEKLSGITNQQPNSGEHIFNT